MRQGLMTPPAEPAAQPPMPGPQAGPPPQGNQAPDPATYFDGGEASPEEQAQYEKVMGVVMKLVHGKKTHDALVKRLENAPPEKIDQEIGDMALTIFTQAEDRMRKKGAEITDSVKLEIGEELLAELIDMAVMVGKVPDDSEAVGITLAGALDVFASRYGQHVKNRGGYDSQQGQMHLAELVNVADHEFPMREMAQQVAQASQQMAGPPPQEQPMPPGNPGGGLMRGPMA